MTEENSIPDGFKFCECGHCNEIIPIGKTSYGAERRFYKYHGRRITKKRICSNCNSSNQDEHWYNDRKGGWWCERCRKRLVDTPKWHDVHYNRYGPMRIVFKGKRVYTNRRPRIGVCNWCRAVKGEINCQTGELCRRTNMAHMEYHDEDPLKDTLEACVSCHIIYDRNAK